MITIFWLREPKVGYFISRPPLSVQNSNKDVVIGKDVEYRLDLFKGTTWVGALEVIRSSRDTGLVWKNMLCGKQGISSDIA